VVELTQVAELVHDNVIGVPLRQKEEFVVEVEVPERSAAAPTAAGVAYGYAVE
jgi:hypothetical protein